MQQHVWEISSCLVLTSTKGEINRLPIGKWEYVGPPGIDLQNHPQDECEASAAIMCKMFYLVFIHSHIQYYRNGLILNIPKNSPFF